MRFDANDLPPVAYHDVSRLLSERYHEEGEPAAVDDLAGDPPASGVVGLGPADGEHVRCDVVRGREDLIGWDADPQSQARIGRATAVTGQELVGVGLRLILHLVAEGRPDTIARAKADEQRRAAGRW